MEKERGGIRGNEERGRRRRKEEEMRRGQQKIREKNSESQHNSINLNMND